MTDQLGSGLDRIIRDLMLRVQKLETAARSGPGLTIGAASGAFLLPATSTPATPSTGVWVYGTAGGVLRMKSATGSDYQVARQGVAVANVASSDAGATYTSGERALINELKSKLNALLPSLRDGGSILP